MLLGSLPRKWFTVLESQPKNVSWRQENAGDLKQWPRAVPHDGASVGPREPTGTEKQNIDQGAGLDGRLFVKQRQETNPEKFCWQNPDLRYYKKITFYLNGGEPQGSERKTNK